MDGRDNNPAMTRLSCRHVKSVQLRPVMVTSTALLLIDYLNYATCAGIDQHRLIVDDGIAIAAHAVIRRDVVILNAFPRQNNARAYFVLIMI